MRPLHSLPTAVLLVLALLITAGCGSEDSSSDSAAAQTTEAGATAAPAAFPVTVQHRYGTTTVTKKPQRIVTVGSTEQDVVLALGHQPVGITDWYGDQPDATWPWAHPLLTTKPIILKADDGINIEAVAKLRPDLIVGTNSGMDKSMYKKLSALAPVVPGPKGGKLYGSPWDQQTQLIADAMGEHGKGVEVIADVKKTFADAVAAHPEFKGKTVTFSQNAFYDGKLYVYPPGLGVEFLDLLGFTVNPRIAPLAEPDTQAEISAERLDVIDADVLVFATEKAADVKNLLKIPTFAPLDAVKGHRAVFTDPILSGAMYFETPLSLKYVAQHLTPLLAEAVAGQAPHAIAETAS